MEFLIALGILLVFLPTVLRIASGALGSTRAAAEAAAQHRRMRQIAERGSER